MRKLLNFLRNKLIFVTIFHRRWWYRCLSSFTAVNCKSPCLFPTFFNGAGTVEIGSRVVIGVIDSPYYLTGYNYIEARSDCAKIIIKNSVQINNHFICIADKTTIEISENTLIGFNVQIYDSNFHDLDPSCRHDPDPNPKPVFIGRNVFIGSNVTILKGVTIGDNSIIGSGSVVTKSFPENALVFGNPAKSLEKTD